MLPNIQHTHDYSKGFDANPNQEKSLKMGDSSVRVKGLRMAGKTPVYHFKSDDGHMEGTFSHLGKSGIATDSVRIHPDGRGKGSYRKLLKGLASTFGSVHSSSTLSDEAHKAWKSVGAAQDGETYSLYSESKKKSKKAPLRGNRYGYGKGLSASDQRRQKRAFKRNVKKYKRGDKSAFEPTAVDKEVMADRKAGRRPEAPESKYNDSMETPKLKVSIINEDWKKAIAKKAKKSGKSAAVLRKVYKRGLAAYASGHRPGMSQHAWAMARVNSYLRGGPARKVDSDIKEGVEHGTQFKMVHVGSDQEGRKTYKLHAHCDHDGHAGHVKFSMHKGHTYIHAMEIKDSLRRQGYGAAMMNEIQRMHDENPDQHGKMHYAGHHEDNAKMPMPEALNIEDIPAAGGDLNRIQQGKKPLRGLKAKIVDAGKAVKRGAKKVMKVIRGDHDEEPIRFRKAEAIEKSGERFSGVNKPKRTPGASKKFAVLAKEGDKTRIVRFGDPNLKIKKHIPGRRKNFRARHGCDKGKLSKLTARYWSCRAWILPLISVMLMVNV